MPRPIAISLSPNTEPDDVSLTWKTLLAWWNWHDSTPLRQAQDLLKNIFTDHQVSLKTSGRQALYDLLRALNISQDDEVIIQAFTCIAVPEPIIWAGATPVYADINPDTLNLSAATIEPKITSQTKAIIVQHTLGYPAPIEEIKALANQHNLILIEDCAHALGAQYNNQPIGTFGHAAILSFGRDKTISSVFGGAVITKNNNLSEKVERYSQERQQAPFIWIKQQLLHPILFSWILPNYFNGLGKAALVALQKVRLLSKAVQPIERQGVKPNHIDYQYPGALATLLVNQLKKLPRYTKRRQTIAHQYRKTLQTSKTTTQRENTTPNYLRYPLFVANRDDLLLAARAQHMLLGDWYDAPLVPSNCSLESFYYQAGSCLHAEAAAEQIINLPTYPTLTDNQVDQVITFIQNEVT